MDTFNLVSAYFAKPYLAEKNSSNDYFFLNCITDALRLGEKVKENGSVWDLFLPLSSLEWHVLFN